MKKIAFIAFGMLCMTGLYANAAPMPPATQPLHFYVGGGVGAIYHSPDYSFMPQYIRPDPGYELFAGYAFTPNWAVQLGYAAMETYTQAENKITIGNTSTLLNPYEKFANTYWTLSGLYTHYYTPMLAVSAELGMAKTEQTMEVSSLALPTDTSSYILKRSDAMFTPLLGAQAKYFWNQHFSTNIGIRYIFGSDARVFRGTYVNEDIDSSLFYNLSVEYHF